MLSPSVEQLNKELDSGLWPVVESITRQGWSLQVGIVVDEKLRYFEGHFPEQAVLPGVVQVHWAGELGRRFFACSGFSSLKKVKFNGVILPASVVKLALQYKPQTGNLTFTYFADDQRFSSGMIAFQGTP